MELNGKEFTTHTKIKNIYFLRTERDEAWWTDEKIMISFERRVVFI